MSEQGGFVGSIPSWCVFFFITHISPLARDIYLLASGSYHAMDLKIFIKIYSLYTPF